MLPQGACATALATADSSAPRNDSPTAGEHVEAAQTTTESAAARSCGTCAMCCKLISVEEINKPQYVWCSHCKPGKGCGIYDTRPNDCRVFQCFSLANRTFGDEWRPDRAKFVMTEEPGTGRVFIVCETSAPGVWWRDPYYPMFKAYLALPGNERKQIVILTGKRLTVLVPQGEFDLGEWNGKKETQVVINFDQEAQAVGASLVASQPEEKKAVEA